MAAPSWAANQGNSNNQGQNEDQNPKLCKPGAYPGVLLSQKGQAFKNATACAAYVENNGLLVGVNAVFGPVEEPVPGFREFSATLSGFGLKPNSLALVYGKYQPSGVTVGGNTQVPVGGNGKVSLIETGPCEIKPFGKVGSLVTEATTAAGSVFILEFPGPSGC
jgi:hypothetical protein